MATMTETTLGECIECVIDYRGKTPKKMGGDWTENGVRVISALNVHKGFIDNEEKIRCVSEEIYQKWMIKKVERDDVFITSEGASLGESCIWDSDEKVVLGQRLYDVRTNKNILDPWFFAFYLQTERFKKQIEQISTGSTVFGMSQPVLLGLKLHLPPIKAQRKIGEFYKAFKRYIENNNKINFELESLAKTIYDYWFLQFDFPNEEGKPYKSSGGAMEYNEELKMDIPKGWEVRKLGELTTLDLGGTPKTEIDSYWNGDVNWLNSGEVAQFPVVSTEAKITTEGMNNSATKMMKKGTVVISITGNIRASILGIDSCGNQSIVGIRETNQLKKSYIYPSICHLLDHYVHLSTGNCQQHINKETLLQTNIIVPPNRLLDNYYEIVEPMYEQIINNGNESFELSSLRDYLLPLLMNGQVGFKDEQ